MSDTINLFEPTFRVEETLAELRVCLEKGWSGAGFKILEIKRDWSRHTAQIPAAGDKHHLDVIKTADHVLDLGPEGGDGGGRIVAQGAPEQVAEVDESFTGRYLAPLLGVQRAQAS